MIASFAVLALADANLPAIALVCVALTLGLLFYTFYLPDEVVETKEKGRLAFLRERKETLYENLRDLNFEYKAGKFPESDYQQMRNSMEEEAAALLAEIERLESAGESDAVSVTHTNEPDPGVSGTAWRGKGHRLPKGVRS
jgi:hypothetical protein